MSSLAPDLDEAARFLSILDEARRFVTTALKLPDTGTQFGFATFDDNKDRKNGRLASRMFGDLDQAIRLTGQAAGQPRATIDLLARMQARGAGVFVTVQQLDGKGAAAKHVNGIRALISDADDDRQLASLHRFIIRSRLEPSIVVASGGLTADGAEKLQAYWCVRDCSVADFPELQELLWSRAGTDRAVNDIARVMRMVGFWHQKSATPRLTRIVSVTSKSYSCSELRQRIEGVSPVDPHAGGNGAGKGANAKPKHTKAHSNGIGSKPEHIADSEGVHLNAAAHEGVVRFANLPAGKQNAMLVAMLEMPAIKTLADEERPEWLRVLFALADAEHQGATEARALALEWSKSSKRFMSEKDFDRDWNSFDPNRPGGITIGTLLKAASDAGFDIGAWLHADNAVPEAVQDGPGPAETSGGTAGETPGTNRVPHSALGDIDLAVLRLNRRPPPPLPLDVFGPHWGPWISHVAEAASCPADYVAAPLLAMASTLVGNARWAQAWPGWAEPPHLWLGSVGDSGDGKSPATDVLLGQVCPEIERRMTGDFPDRHREWQAKAARAKVDKAHWEARARAMLKANKPPPAMPTDPGIGDEPQEPRLCCQDVTIERVATLLATAAPKGLLMVRDELAGFLLGMTAYSDAARPFWLESYGGRPYSVDRQKYATQIKVPHNAVSWCGGTQPERLGALLEEQPDDGLFARFAWIWPEPIPFDRPRRPPDVEFAIRALDRLRLLDMRKTDKDVMRPIYVMLCAAAQDRMVTFGRQMQRQKDLAAGLLRSAYGKARGLALRLSLMLEFLWWSGVDGTDPPPMQIGEEAFVAACRLVANYLIPMAERVYGDVACSQEDRNTAVLAQWIRDADQRPAEVHVRTIMRARRLAGLTKADAIHTACLALVEAGWLRPPSGGPRTKGSLVAYPVNPALWRALAGLRDLTLGLRKL